MYWNSKRLLWRLDATPSADHMHDGRTVPIIYGETLAVGNAVYLKNDGKVWKADADAVSTMPCMGIIIRAGVADNEAPVLIWGFMRDDTWDWTFGGGDGRVYVDTTAGALVQPAPSGSGDQVQTVGIAFSADVLRVNPSDVLVVVA